MNPEQLKAEIERLQAALATSTEANMHRDAELRQIAEAKAKDEATRALATKAQEVKEVELRNLLASTTAKMDEVAKEAQVLRSRVAESQVGQPAHLHVASADGYEALLRTQLGLLLTDITPEDSWPVLVEKWIKKHKPKNGRGEVILRLDPLRVANPDILFVVVGWIAMIDMDATGNTVELLMTKITQRYAFSEELVEEVGLLLLSTQRTLQVTAAGKKPSEKMTAMAEVVQVLQRRVEWLEKRLAQRTRPDSKGNETPPGKRVALRGDHR